MQDEITVSPLVDILSKQLGKQVVMSGSDYVMLLDKSVVAQADVDVAIIEQANDYLLRYKLSKAKEIEDEFSKATTALSSATPHEMISWRKQEEQARAYLADNTVATPMLNAIIISRGLNEAITDFSALVIGYADAYEADYGSLLGKYQKLSKNIDSATTVDEVKLVSWT